MLKIRRISHHQHGRPICRLLAVRSASTDGRRVSSALDRFEVPSLAEFPQFLKAIESKWKVKVARRFDREQYVGSKEELAAGDRPRYILSMFPYPSGRLHLGHVRIYTSGDILARYSRLLRNNDTYAADYNRVINPMGFDSFGLPAENAARERGLNPANWTNSNIRTMKAQLDSLAFQFDWREATSNPNFYKWTQELFLKLMDANLVYKSFAEVNWDPVDKTVLADEQVDDDGRSWRSGALVEKRNYRQWFIKVNAFANDIYQAHDVDPESWQDVLSIQRNWIGKPSGWIFYLPVETPNVSETLPVFTKNPEIFASSETTLLISSNHWLEKVYRISEKGFIKNPFSGGQMKVLRTEDVASLPSGTNATLSHPELCDDSKQISVKRDQIILQAKLNGFGGYYTSDRYRDWLVSRQRFWGTPIPVVECKKCGYRGVERESLPVRLPEVEDFDTKLRSPDTTSEFHVSSPLSELAPIDWIQSSCPCCFSESKRECETFDTLFDSSWYFLRYSAPPTGDKPFDPDRVLPVWCYIGGKEHASMHLFYARFVTHFLHSQGMLPFREPFRKLLVQGVVKSSTYSLNGRYLSRDEYEALEDKSQVTVSYDKMSKSKGNGVDPQDLLDAYGVDATRFCLMSYANPRTERLWRSNSEEFTEVLVFMRKIALTVQEYCQIAQLMREQTPDRGTPKIQELSSYELDSKRSQLRDLQNRVLINSIILIEETNQFRQFISALHTLFGPIRSNLRSSMVYSKEYAEALAALIVMLNPIAPHFSEELWLNFSRCTINPLKMDQDTPYKINMQAGDQPWPTPDDKFPRAITIKTSDTHETIDKVEVSKDHLKGLDEKAIVKFVESHFGSKFDNFTVRDVKKFSDLKAHVVVNIKSANLKATQKKNKKKVPKNSTNVYS